MLKLLSFFVISVTVIITMGDQIVAFVSLSFFLFLSIVKVKTSS